MQLLRELKEVHHSGPSVESWMNDTAAA